MQHRIDQAARLDGAAAPGVEARDPPLHLGGRDRLVHVCEEGVHLGEVDPPLPVVVVLAKEGGEDPAQARLVLHG